jgi:SH3 domain protein
MTINHTHQTLYRIALLGLLLVGSTANAETRYVTDELQLALHEKIDSQGKLLLRLDSGTELELLETSGFYARVRTLDGVVGWTKAGFLIAEKPARVQLTDMQSANAALQEKLEARQQAFEASQAELAKVKDSENKAYAEMAERVEKAEKIAATVERLQQENETYRQQLSRDEVQLPLKWGMIAAGIALLLGILAGIALFDYRSRKRHGGYRIY